MSTWAYPCRACSGDGEWLVSTAQVAELPPEVNILRVKVGGDWVCATVDRTRPLAVVEASVLREAVASDAHDCPACARAEVTPPAPAVADEAPRQDASAQVQAAAISLQGRRFVVVLVPLDLVRSGGEADMLAADLRPRFGGADLVLMGQTDDGTPEYHGAAELCALLADVPVDRMPWKTYHLR